jgi:hypothetical protein
MRQSRREKGNYIQHRALLTHCTWPHHKKARHVPFTPSLTPACSRSQSSPSCRLPAELDLATILSELRPGVHRQVHVSGTVIPVNEVSSAISKAVQIPVGTLKAVDDPVLPLRNIDLVIAHPSNPGTGPTGISATVCPKVHARLIAEMDQSAGLDNDLRTHGGVEG